MRKKNEVTLRSNSNTSAGTVRIPVCSVRSSSGPIWAEVSSVGQIEVNI